MKTRMTVADIAAEVACLRATCIGARVANVYDVNARTYLLKLSRSAASAGGARVCRLAESFQEPEYIQVKTLSSDAAVTQRSTEMHSCLRLIYILLL